MYITLLVIATLVINCKISKFQIIHLHVWHWLCSNKVGIEMRLRKGKQLFAALKYFVYFMSEIKQFICLVIKHYYSVYFVGLLLDICRFRF